jgi:elongation factor 1-beta
MALSTEIYKIELEGLVWNKEPKLVEVAYGMKKLQVGCIVEDDKVLSDDLFELIEAIGGGEEIQSLDIASM